MRKIVAATLFALAVGLIVLSYGALRWLWAENPDSPDSVYIKVAAVEWGIAALLVAIGFWILRRQ
jgi:hypothetical protein